VAVDFGKVEAATGWQLADTQALRASLASKWAVELGVAEVTAKAESAISAGLESAISGFSARVPLASIGSVWSSVLGITRSWEAVISLLAADLAENDGINLSRTLAARDKVFGLYKPGDWWTTARVDAKSKNTVVKPYGQPVSEFLAQVSPEGVVYSAARGSGRRDVMRPAWAQNDASPHTRFVARPGEQALDRQLGYFHFNPVENTDCSLSDVTLTCEQKGTEWDKIPKIIRKIASWACLPLNVSQGCTVSPGWLHFCLGAAPFWGWQGQPWAWSPVGVMLASQIRSPTPLHLAIEERTVRESLWAIVQRSGILELPVTPGQTKDGVWRRPNSVRIVLQGQAAQSWSPASRLIPGAIVLTVPGPALQKIIDAHLDWLALRRAILLTMTEQTQEMVAAAKASREQDVRAATDGKLPTTYWSYEDPLGLFREPPPAARPLKNPTSNPFGSRPISAEIEGPIQPPVLGPNRDVWGLRLLGVSAAAALGLSFLRRRHRH
jgi:hypothetical protein